MIAFDGFQVDGSATTGNLWSRVHQALGELVQVPARYSQRLWYTPSQAPATCLLGLVGAALKSRDKVVLRKSP